MNALLKKLTQLDFYAVDLQLYLDTHPEDKEAIREYNRVVKEAAAVRAEYEKQCGPLFSFMSESDPDMFGWVDEPWNWTREFNDK